MIKRVLLLSLVLITHSVWGADYIRLGTLFPDKVGMTWRLGDGIYVADFLYPPTGGLVTQYSVNGTNFNVH